MKTIPFQREGRPAQTETRAEYRSICRGVRLTLVPGALERNDR